MSIMPSDGSQGVSRRAFVEVAFDRPMVDLKERKQPVPIVIEPEAKGNGRWISEDTYRFSPSALAGATHYTVTVPADTASLGGATLRKDYTFVFSTARPVVKSVTPEVDVEAADPGGAVRVVFDQPMDRKSVESRFTLVDAREKPVAGSFSWSGASTMVFRPDEPLARSAVYRATLAAGALARSREMGTAEAHTWQFTVAGKPCLVSSSPADGDMAAHPNDRLVLTFNVPMDRASVEQALHIDPEPEYVDIHWTIDYTRLEAYVNFDPSSEYRVLLGSTARDRYGEPLTGNRSIVFRSAPLSPVLSLYGPQEYYQGAVGSYVADGQVEQYVEALNVDEVAFSLSSVEPAHFMAAYRNRYEGPDPRTITHTLVHTWTQSFDLPLNQIKYVPVTVADADGNLRPGIYLLEARSEGLRDARFMVVSRANLALKWGPRQVFVWATDVVDGQPISDMHVTVYKGDGTLLAEGTTNAAGVFVAKVDLTASDEYWYRWEESLFVVGEGPQGLAFCSNMWDQSITTWDFGLPGGDEGDGAAVYLYSDRPIYRPGQTVHFKGIARADDDGRYALLDAEHRAIPVSIQDSYGNELFSGDLPLSEFGTFHGELKLSESAPLGQYVLQASPPGVSEPQRLTFTVSEYRKPEFKVEVLAGTGDLAYAVHGDTITVTVQADYYFGQPVTGAPVRWTVRGSPYYFSLSGEWYSFGEYGDGWWYYGEERYDEGRMIYSSGEGRADENGRFEIGIPVDLSESKVSQVLFIEAVLTDASDQEVAGSAVVVAHKTDTYLGVRPLRYVGAPAAPQTIQIVALDPLRNPRAGLPVTVELYSRHWDTVREKTDSGGYVWRNVLTEELVSTQVVTTSADGRVQAAVTPPIGGSYKVVVRALDGMGNEVLSSTYLWVWSEEYVNWGVSNHNRIQLIADKREYEPGDVAEILVTAPFTGCLALITVERGGVLSYEVQRLESTSALVRVPILADYAPNAFVSVSLLKGQQDGFPAPVFRLGYVELRVTRQEQQLNVTVTPDKERYRPGETATYTIRVTDYLGRPVTAELSVSAVDAAVLALLGDNSAPILDAFYHTRGLGVWNAQTLVIGVERMNEELVERGKGGGGGGEEGGEDVRRDFRDTAYWAPTVVTDWDGRAVVQVTLPDDLTTWRLRVKGVTVDTRVGDGSVDVISTKDLLVRPVLPRFFTIGDEATVAALVHNYTPVSQTVRVEMQTTGLEVPGGLVVRTVVIGPGRVEKVAWDVTVPKGREAKVLFSARVPDAGISDAVEITLPVHAYAETTVIAANESVPLDEGGGERLVVTVELPDDASDMDEIVIEMAPSLGAGIRTGLEYLTGYPYG